ncbi:MAG: hypothetical protein IID08_00740 [Candidatus Hydrogenedentes bacterium]|nr:hypothetical protein [Candidatus Hydrogenedentota bacterium]
MSRDYRTYLRDIEQSCGLVEHATQANSTVDLLNDRDACDSLMKSLSVIVDSARHIPENARERIEGVDWNSVFSLEDIADLEPDQVDEAIRILIPRLHFAVENCTL